MSRGKVYEDAEARARSRDPTDFWGQVGRTVRGRPVDEGQIALLVGAIVAGLDLDGDDVLVDLCCGNGAITDRVIELCGVGVGVDFSDYLIDVAKRHFEKPPRQTYVLANVIEFVAVEPEPLRFTKGLCYGSFGYLSRDDACRLLATLRQRFTALRRCFIGNVPDKSRLDAFFDPATYVPGVENEPASPIGVWWTIEEFERLAAATGWGAQFRRMPPAYYAAHYRYDVVLVPA